MDNEFRKLNLFSVSSLARNKNILIALIVVVILALVGIGFMYFQYQKTSNELKKFKSQLSTTTQSGKEDEVKRLVSDISKIMRLPENETPSIATITDVSKLKDQPFFKNAKNGDVLLVFNKSGKAILYDPKDKKVVDTTTLTTTASFNQQFKVVIRNGTAIPNLAGKMEEDLKKTLGVVNVVSKENTQKQTYEKTQVIVINQAALEFASNVAKAINAQVAEMSVDEPKPKDADILIIIGKDRTQQ